MVEIDDVFHLEGTEYYLKITEVEWAGAKENPMCLSVRGDLNKKPTVLEEIKRLKSYIERLETKLEAAKNVLR